MTFEIDIAPDTLAILPIMGISGWDGPTGEYGQMHGQQLFYIGFLAKLAQKLQPVDRQVGRLPSRLRCVDAEPDWLKQVYLRTSRRRE
jgi:hypothetical protein